MPGGARAGAGRPKGSKNRFTVHGRAMDDAKQFLSGLDVPPEIAAMTPLQVMLKAMAIEAAKDNWKQAAFFAKEAAPYVHPRLTSVNVNATVKKSIDDFTDEELALIAIGAEGGEERAD